jgi:CSLREA domain-containing protein
MSRTSYLRRPLAALLLAASLVMAAVVLASPAQAATFTVNTAADEQNTNAQCSLREAIINANQDNQSGSTDCGAGAGDDTINFNLGSTATITLGSQLPAITGIHPAGLIIDGGSADITISGDNKYRVFEVAFVEVTLRNLTVANGAIATVGEGGGGIINRGGTLTVSNSTLSGNSASFGGGTNNSSGQATSATSTFKNTIVAANDASVLGPDVWGSFTSQGHNLIGQSGCSVGCFTNGDLVGTAANPIDPMLGPLANNGGPTMTHALLEGSPAIDKGNSFGESTDQRGLPRPSDFVGIVNAADGSDIGAFELQAPPTPPDTTPPKVTSTVPANGREVGPAVNVKATFSEKMLRSSINGQTFKLFKKGSTTKIAATVSYSASTRTAKLDPTNNLRRGVTYKAVVTTEAKDLAGNRLDQNTKTTGLQQKVWFFTVDD